MKLTLKDLIARALEARPEIKIAGTRHEEAEGYRLKARAAKLPRLDLEMSYLRFDEQPSVTLGSFQTDATIDMRRIKEEFPVLGAGPDEVKVPVGFDNTRVRLMGENLFSNVVTLKQPLFAGGRIREKEGQAKIGLEMAELERERVLRLVTGDVKQRFFRFLFARKGSRLLGESAKRVVIVERFLKNLHENYLPKKGEGQGEGLSRIDWLKASVLASQILAKREEALAQVEMAGEDLRYYCALEEGVDISVEEKLPEFVLPSLSTVRQKLQSIPERKIAEAQREMARSEVRFAEGGRYPEVGAYGFFSYALDNFPSKPLLGGGGVTLKFPLFDGFERKGEIRRVQALHRRASLEVELLEKEIQPAVVALTLSTEELRKRIGHLKRAEKEARERRELASESYLLDFGKYEDYLDALKEELETGGLLLAAELQYWTNAAKLESIITP